MGGHKFNPAMARHLDSPIRNFLVPTKKFLKDIQPPLSERLDPKEVDRLADEAGLKKGRTWRWSRSIVGWEYLNEPFKEEP